MQAFMKLQMPEGTQVSVNVDDIVAVIGQEGAKGARLLLDGGHEVEVLHAASYVLINIQRLLVGKEPLPDED